MAAHYGRVNLPAGGSTERHKQGRISKKEQKFWKDITPRKETIAREKILCSINLSKEEEKSAMKAWAHKANVAFCTIFFFYQVCLPQEYPDMVFETGT